MRLISEDSLAATPVWLDLIQAIEEGHRLPRPQIADVFQGNNATTMLSRAAFVDGLGCGVKTVTVVPENHARNLPSIQGAMLCFDVGSGEPRALVDSALITGWKTAADSVLGAQYLARLEPLVMTIFGAGAVAHSIAKAYVACFSSLEKVTIYNRTAERAEKRALALQAEGVPADVATDPRIACRHADIIATATMSRTPILTDDWVQPGTHVDLIGAYKADMREADDALLKRARLFVDSRDTTLDHIGELRIPLANGVIRREDVLGDLYDLVNGASGRTSQHDITVFKNGGGAHLDLMTADYLIQLAQQQ